MGDQPENPNLAAENNAEDNPNLLQVNPEGIPLQGEGGNMAQWGVQGGQLSRIAVFSGNKGLEALMNAEAQ